MELGVDLGTSSTVAFLRRDDGATEPVLFDGAPLLPSAVFADESGQLLVGRDAVHSARARPERFEGSPKSRIDEGTVFLGTEVRVEALLGALLHRAAAEARRIGGAPVAGVTICHPASWGPNRRSVLQRAAAATGLDRVRLVPEPVAAAAFHLRRHATGPADLLVYDLGAGTFDVAVVRHTPGAALEVLSSGGLDDTGGQDVDAAIVGLLRERCGPPELWARLDNPATVADRAARRQLWDDVRSAKEMLSRVATTTLFLPLLETDQVVTRAEVERLAAPLIQRTLDAVAVTLANSPVPLRPLGGVVLVGGASRMPLVATMLHRALNIPPTTIDQPELVVAAGSIDPLLIGGPALAVPQPFAQPVAQPQPQVFAQPQPVSPQPVPPPQPPVQPQPFAHPQATPAWQPAAPPHQAWQPPVPAGPPAVITIVELISVSTPTYTGVTLRGQLHAGFGVMEHIFPATADGGLLLFSDANALARHAVAHAAEDSLLATPAWRVRNDGADELRFDLDLLPEHIAAPPETWLPGFVCRCRDLAAQLAIFLDLPDADDLVGEHSVIDRADDILRRVRNDPSARAVRRKLARLDHAQLLEDWAELIARIDRSIVQPG
ncbi:Hsp70 family protein [Dactylosporangium sp. NPDC049140]|uniref:Hsp70 family protein n=1 Tax=Dactylosporangium sp. NPDC049140 TaxID=3155647 RepID=UPI0033CF49D9